MGTYIATTVLGLAAGSTGALLAAGVVNLGISYALNKALAPDIPEQRDQGVRARLPANTANKIPVIYGEARVKGITFFGDISADNQKLAVLLALSEGPINEIGKVIYDGFTLTLDDEGYVTSAVDADGETTDHLNNKLRIVKYPMGGRCSQMETFSTRWAQNGSARAMPNLAYVYIELTYDRENGLTGISNTLSFDLQGRTVRTFDDSGNLSEAETYSTNPAECLLDYMTNSRYGAGRILEDISIDLPSFFAHKQFCDTELEYRDLNDEVQMGKRYTCNGFVGTTETRDIIISDFLQCSGGVLTYDTGRFKLLSDAVGSSIMNFDNSNIYGSVSRSEGGFDVKLNEVVTKYNSKANEFQEDQLFIAAPSSIRNSNEPELTTDYTLVFNNNNIEAERLGTILLNKSRNSDTIQFTTDYRALQLQAHDLITVSRPAMGIINKVYRINSISEAMLDNGVPGFAIVAQEYADEIYEDLMVQEKDPAPNVSLPSPRAIPAVTNLALFSLEDSGQVPNFELSFTIPNALIDRYDIYYGNSAAFMEATLFKTETTSTSAFTPGQNVVTLISGLPPASWFFWVVCRNSIGSSSESNVVNVPWNPILVEGEEFFLIFAEDATGTDQSYTQGNRNYFAFYKASSQPLLPVSGVEFRPYGGEQAFSQRIDLSYATVTDSPAVEIQTITVNPLARAQSASLSGSSEVQALNYSGDGSNVIIGTFDRETVRIALSNDFDSGLERENQQFIVDNFDAPVIFNQPGNYAFPSGGTLDANTMFTYVPASGQAGNINNGDFVFIGSESTNISNGFFEVTYTVITASSAANSSRFRIDWPDADGSGTSSASYSFDDQTLGTRTATLSFNENNIFIEPGEEVGIAVNSSSQSGLQIRIDSLTFNSGTLTPASVSYDPDVTNEQFSTGGSVTIDYADVQLQGSARFVIVGTALDGTANTGLGDHRYVNVNFLTSDTPSSMVAKTFSVLATALRDDVSLTTTDSSITISSSLRSFIFWTRRTASISNFDDIMFDFDSDFIVRPEFSVNGETILQPDTGSPALTGGFNIELPNTILDPQLNTDSAVSQIAQLIASIDTRISWDGSISDFEVAAAPASIEIDCSNVEWDGNGSVFGYLHGNWTIGGIPETITVPTSTDQPTFANNFATEIFDEIQGEVQNNSMFSVSRTGNVVTLSSTGRLIFTSNVVSSSGATFGWDSNLSVQPTINVISPTAENNVGTQGAPQIDVGVTSFSGRSVDLIHLGDEVLEQTFTITANDSNMDLLDHRVEAFVTSQEEETSFHSIYSVFDYSNSEITSFTGSRPNSDSPSDIPEIAQRIITAINQNAETPVDFTAELDPENNRIVLSAGINAAVDGLFRVDVNNDSGNGNVVFTPEVLVQGQDPIGSTPPLIDVISPQGVVHRFFLFDHTTVSVTENFIDIANEIVDNIRDDAWSISNLNNTITFVANVGGLVDGLWDVSIVDLGTSGTTMDELQSPYFATNVIQEGSTIYSEARFASGKVSIGNYVQAEPLETSNYRAERTVSWYGIFNEPDVSTDIRDYQYIKNTTDAELPVQMQIYANNGTSFRNGVGTTELTANVRIGTELQTDVQHSTYDYNWSYRGNIICVDANRNVINDSDGTPLTARDVDGTVICTFGFPADSTISGNLGPTLRRITVGAEDVNQMAQIDCEVSNI